MQPMAIRKHRMNPRWFLFVPVASLDVLHSQPFARIRCDGPATVAFLLFFSQEGGIATVARQYFLESPGDPERKMACPDSDGNSFFLPEGSRSLCSFCLRSLTRGGLRWRLSEREKEGGGDDQEIC
ncbi:hypothetical protein MRX96_012929 [Rhipicephalus microplus]